MTAAARLAGFGAVVAAVFGAATLAGAAIGPDPDPASAPEEGHGAMGAGPAPAPVRGLAAAQDGLRLVVEDPELRRSRTQELRFRIANPQGQTVRDFDVEHTKRMHVVVARRDLTGFQHLHPTQRPDGSWTVPVRLADAGSYRLFADFSHDEQARTLATDLRVDGPADLRPLPAARPAAQTADGYAVRLIAGAVRPGREAALRFAITRDGRPVTPQSYLGAQGHLVALREGDLAFLHVHPAGTEGAAEFDTTFPTEGRYRLFLQFRDAGRVHTAAFTQEVHAR